MIAAGEAVTAQRAASPADTELVRVGCEGHRDRGPYARWPFRHGRPRRLEQLGHLEQRHIWRARLRGKRFEGRFELASECIGRTQLLRPARILPNGGQRLQHHASVDQRRAAEPAAHEYADVLVNAQIEETCAAADAADLSVGLELAKGARQR